MEALEEEVGRSHLETPVFSVVTPTQFSILLKLVAQDLNLQIVNESVRELTLTKLFIRLTAGDSKQRDKRVSHKSEKSLGR